MSKVTLQSSLKGLKIEELLILLTDGGGNIGAEARKCLLTHPDITVANLEYLLDTGTCEERQRVKEVLVDHPDALPAHFKYISKYAESHKVAVKAQEALLKDPGADNYYMEYLSRNTRTEKIGLALLARPNITFDQLKYLSTSGSSSYRVSVKAIEDLVLNSSAAYDQIKYTTKYAKIEEVLIISNKALINHPIVTAEDLKNISRVLISTNQARAIGVKKVVVLAQMALLTHSDVTNIHLKYLIKEGLTGEISMRARKVRGLTLKNIIHLL